jgi:uncharacterized protein YlaI
MRESDTATAYDISRWLICKFKGQCSVCNAGVISDSKTAHEGSLQNEPYQTIRLQSLADRIARTEAKSI